MWIGRGNYFLKLECGLDLFTAIHPSTGNALSRAIARDAAPGDDYTTERGEGEGQRGTSEGPSQKESRVRKKPAVVCKGSICRVGVDVRRSC